MHMSNSILVFFLYGGRVLCEKSTVHITKTSTTTVTPTAASEAPVLSSTSKNVDGRPTVFVTIASTTTVIPTIPAMPFGNASPTSDPATTLSSSQVEPGASHTINTVIDKKYCVLICPATMPVPVSLPTLLSNTTSGMASGNTGQTSSLVVSPSTAATTISTPVVMNTPSLPPISIPILAPTPTSFPSPSTMPPAVPNTVEEPKKMCPAEEINSALPAEPISARNSPSYKEDDAAGEEGLDSTSEEATPEEDGASKDKVAVYGPENESHAHYKHTRSQAPQKVDGVVSMLAIDTETKSPTKSIGDNGKSYMEPARKPRYRGDGRESDPSHYRTTEFYVEGRGTRGMGYPGRKLVRWVLEHVG